MQICVTNENHTDRPISTFILTQIVMILSFVTINCYNCDNYDTL